MTALIRISVALALSACIAGCAAPTPGPSTIPSAVVTPLRTKAIPEGRARDAVAVGKSTKADVAAALGETLIISFDSGFEVWVYRLDSDVPAKTPVARSGSRKEAETPATGEFVVLFAPSGVVAKTRIRPASENATAGERR